MIHHDEWGKGYPTPISLAKNRAIIHREDERREQHGEVRVVFHREDPPPKGNKEAN